MAFQSVFAARLREARMHLGLSQKGLGIAAGIDESSASPRINQYEKGKHLPDLLTVDRLASVLGVPPAFFFTDDDHLADLLRHWNTLTADDRDDLLARARAGSERTIGESGR